MFAKAKQGSFGIVQMWKRARGLLSPAATFMYVYAFHRKGVSDVERKLSFLGRNNIIWSYQYYLHSSATIPFSLSFNGQIMTCPGRWDRLKCSLLFPLKQTQGPGFHMEEYFFYVG